MALNVELLNKVKDAILTHPEQFDMNHWFRKTDCGTAACIAGWCCALEGGGLEAESHKWFNHTMYSAGERAHDALGLDGIGNDEAHCELFYDDCWPKDLYKKYHDATTPQEAAQVAAERIDRFIAENA